MSQQQNQPNQQSRRSGTQAGQSANAANAITINFDQKAMQELQDMAQELDTDPASVVKKAYYLFLLAQGRTVKFKQKKSNSTLVVDDFAGNKKRIEQ
jgi:hypothetical protein